MTHGERQDFFQEVDIAIQKSIGSQIPDNLDPQTTTILVSASGETTYHRVPYSTSSETMEYSINTPEWLLNEQIRMQKLLAVTCPLLTFIAYVVRIDGVTAIRVSTPTNLLSWKGSSIEDIEVNSAWFYGKIKKEHRTELLVDLIRAHAIVYAQ